MNSSLEIDRNFFLITISKTNRVTLLPFASSNCLFYLRRRYIFWKAKIWRISHDFIQWYFTVYDSCNRFITINNLPRSNLWSTRTSSYFLWTLVEIDLIWLHFLLNFLVDPSLMIVTWITMNPINESVVEYGENPMFDQRATGKFSIFQDGGTEKRREYIHRVVLTDLRPGQRYCKKK